MLILRRANRRHRGYQWFKLKNKRRKGFISKRRRPSIKVH